MIHYRKRVLYPSLDLAIRKTKLGATARVPFENLTPIHPNGRITLETDTTPDEVLNSLADMAVKLGGKTPDGQDRWHFSLLFLGTVQGQAVPSFM